MLHDASFQHNFCHLLPTGHPSQKNGDLCSAGRDPGRAVAGLTLAAIFVKGKAINMGSPGSQRLKNLHRKENMILNWYWNWPSSLWTILKRCDIILSELSPTTTGAVTSSRASPLQQPGGRPQHRAPLCRAVFRNWLWKKSSGFKSAGRFTCNICGYVSLVQWICCWEYFARALAWCQGRTHYPVLGSGDEWNYLKYDQKHFFAIPSENRTLLRAGTNK